MSSFEGSKDSVFEVILKVLFSSNNYRECFYLSPSEASAQIIFMVTVCNGGRQIFDSDSAGTFAAAWSKYLDAVHWFS